MWFPLPLFSTVSSGLNSLAAVVAEDVVKPFWHPNEQTYTRITKGLGKYDIGNIMFHGPHAYITSYLTPILRLIISWQWRKHAYAAFLRLLWTQGFGEF